MPHAEEHTGTQRDAAKRAAAAAAVDYVRPGCLLGVGSGSTVALFIEALGASGVRPSRAVSTSSTTDSLLVAIGVTVVPLESVDRPLDVYVDGADEIDALGRAIKGGGGAHTREKLVAAASKLWVCIVDEGKIVPYLGYRTAVPIEIENDEVDSVMEILRAWGASPLVREGWNADPRHVLVDVGKLDLSRPGDLESRLETLPGVVACGIFAHRTADIVLVGSHEGEVTTLRPWRSGVTA